MFFFLQNVNFAFARISQWVQMYTKNLSWIEQVYVPYCTSDAYSGRKAASSETGGYAFFGKVQFFENNLTV